MELHGGNIGTGGILKDKVHPITGAIRIKLGSRCVFHLAAVCIVLIQPVNCLRTACGFDFCGDHIGLACCNSILLCAFGIAVRISRLGQDAVFYLRPTPQGPGKLLPVFKIHTQLEYRCLGSIPHIFQQDLINRIISCHSYRLLLGRIAFLQAQKLHIIHLCGNLCAHCAVQHKAHTHLMGICRDGELVVKVCFLRLGGDVQPPEGHIGTDAICSIIINVCRKLCALI